MDIRNLTKEDMCNEQFRHQFCELLNTELLDQATAMFVFSDRYRESVKTFVGTDDQNMPIATVSLVLERKFIYGGMLNGHIEDVAVLPNYRCKGLGTEIVKYAMEFAKRHCKRVVLECKKSLEPFYEIHGFATHSIAMRQQNEKLNNPNISRKIEGLPE